MTAVEGASEATRRRKAGKPYRGLPMEGPVARWYARNTAGDARGFGKLARAVASRLAPGSAVLELAPGPGYLAIELAKAGPFEVTGLDISRTFVRIAGDNSRQAGVAVEFLRGDAAGMPFSAAQFDFVICCAEFKNFTDPEGALAEIHRVLKPGAGASIFDLRREARLDEIDRHVADMRLSKVSAFMTRQTFRRVLLRNAYSRAAMEAMVARSPFVAGAVLDDGIGFELRLQKPAGPPA